MKPLPAGLDDSPAFPRANHLALASFLIGCFTLVAQFFGLCTFYCSAPALMIPTSMGLLTGAYAWRQARVTGIGKELAAAGLVLGLINLAISSFFVLLMVFYGLVIGAAYLASLM